MFASPNFPNASHNQVSQASEPHDQVKAGKDATSLIQILFSLLIPIYQHLWLKGGELHMGIWCQTFWPALYRCGGGDITGAQATACRMQKELGRR